MRIIFVRHGEPDYARDCLTEAGRRQAAAAAERLALDIKDIPLHRAIGDCIISAKCLQNLQPIHIFMRLVVGLRRWNR